MSVKVKIVDVNGIEHTLPQSYWHINDATGDIRGDFWSSVSESVGTVQVAEIRFVMSRPIQIYSEEDEPIYQRRYFLLDEEIQANELARKMNGQIARVNVHSISTEHPTVVTEKFEVSWTE